MKEVTKKIITLGVMVMIMIGMTLSVDIKNAIAQPPNDPPEVCKVDAGTVGGRTEAMNYLAPYIKPGNMAELMNKTVSNFHWYLGDKASSSLPSIYKKFPAEFWEQPVNNTAISQISSAETKGFKNSKDPCENFLGSQFSEEFRTKFLTCYKDKTNDKYGFEKCGMKTPFI